MRLFSTSLLPRDLAGRLRRLGALGALFSAVAAPAFAQGPFTGKPRYQVQVRQAGGSINGQFELELFPAIAPHHVRNWDSLVTYHFFDTTAFHRVVPGFVIQGGDPNSRHGPRSTWGYGQPNQPTVNAEFTALSHERGILSAARDNNINSASSQFFICVAAARSLNGQYSAYGQVTSGMSVVDQIVNAPRDADDNPLQKIEMFVTRLPGDNNAVPGAPGLVAPASGSATSSSPVLRWHAVPTAMLYTAQLSPDSTFTTSVLRLQASQLDSSLTVPSDSLLASTRYYWRIEANNGGRVSTSVVWNFRTGLAAPTLVSPSLGAQNISVTPLLTWQAVPGADSYRLQLARGLQFTPSQILFDQDSIATTSFQVPASAMLPANRVCHWRVQAYQAGLPGFRSAPWNFRTGTAMAVATAAATPELLAQNTPNPAPAGTPTVIHYTLPAPGSAELTITDLLGRLVAQPLPHAEQIAGDHQVTVSTAGLAPGVYLYHLHVGGQTVTRRLVVL